MGIDPLAIIIILSVTMVLFIQGRWRYDLVALAALVSCVLVGLVPADQAFIGFGHPAVITVAAVLILSKSLTSSGLLDRLVIALDSHVRSRTGHLVILTGLAGFFSAFMNNVGALALLMPVSIQTAQKAGYSPARLLMPVAFASILGGLTTLIGTPPNIIISAYRAAETGVPFSMFDFLPVGGTVATIGILFIIILARRLLPKHRSPDQIETHKLFTIERYVTEVQLSATSPFIGQKVFACLDKMGDEIDIIGLIRGERTSWIPQGMTLQPEDILILQTDAKSLSERFSDLGLEIVSDKDHDYEQDLKQDKSAVMEVVILPQSQAIGRSVKSIELFSRHAIHLLAASRDGEPSPERLSDIQLQSGDVLLLQGEQERLQKVTQILGACALGESKPVMKPTGFKDFLPLICFVLGILFAATGTIPAQISLFAAVIMLLLLGGTRLQDAYEAIDWPVIVLLGAMIPVGNALESSGATNLIAQQLQNLTAGTSTLIIMTVLMGLTMLLTAIMNNAATAVVMSPLAIGMAHQLQVSVDPLLMCVCIGASCSFITPIGHQNNTLVMGPGGYQFGDFWRLGLPLQIVVGIVALLIIPEIWPFQVPT